MRNHLLFGAAVAALVIPAAASAQQITSGIVGTVTDDAGAPVAGATVVIRDTRTGAERSVTTDGSGSFGASGLVSGGPYTVAATADGFEGQTVENINTSVSGNTSLTFALAAGGGDIVVTGSRVRVAQLATGPGQSFSSEVIEALPSFDRDIRDILRVDPRVSLERNLESDRVSCLGGNDRSNAFTVDGIAQGDNYGLTDTPFSSRSGTPIPFGAVRETSVEFAPFSVEYGQFTGCAINVVTKSGSNQFHGDAFFQYGDSSLAGNSVAGRPAKAAADDIRYGGSLGGPIIPDRLFFFGAYEHSTVTLSQDEGPAGGGFPNERAFLTVAQFNEISEVLRTVYGRDTMGIVQDRKAISDRYFGRLDWYINDDHRLEGTYQRTEENQVRGDDFGQTGANITGFDNFQNSGSYSDYASVRLYSNWSDVFSTEVRYSRSEITDAQDPVGGGEAQDADPRPRFVIGTQNGSSQGLFISGPGFSRSANDLYTTIDQYKLKGTINAGAHKIMIGAELNTVNFDNLFVQNATGSLYFANVQALRDGLLNNGTLTSVTQARDVIAGTTIGAEGAFTRDGNVNTARAKFDRSLYSAYIQDVWQATDALELTGGVRVDWYDGGHPELNPNFQQRYGFSNTTGFSNLDPVVLPRFAFNYDLGGVGGFMNRARLKGGVGIFSGGDPGVWFGNAFQNNGYGFASADTRDCPAGQIDVVQNGQFTGLPACFRTAAQERAGRGLGDTQSIDPNIEIPTVVRANLGFEAQFGTGGGFFSGWNLNLDYIYSKYRKGLTVVDLSQTIDIRRGLNGYTIDGNPIFAAIDPTATGCAARLVRGGVDIQWANVTAPCFNTQRDDELQLTNGRSYESHIASLVLSKNFEGGFFTSGGRSFLNFGYAYTDAQDRRNMFNSTAGSNYDNLAATSLQDPPASRGFYETRHNFTLAANLTEQFFGEDAETSLGFTFIARSGRPYSLTFGGSGGFFDAASGFDNRLLYIPNGANDPNVVYRDTVSGGAVTRTAAQNQTDFLNYIDNLDCAKEARGRVIERNTCSNDWYFDLDLNFSQEVPGPFKGDSLRFTVTVDNFLNMLDDNWNSFRKRQFASLINVVGTPTGTSGATLGPVDSQGRYIVNSFQPDDTRDLVTSASLWRLRVGVSYRF